MSAGTNGSSVPAPRNRSDPAIAGWQEVPRVVAVLSDGSALGGGALTPDRDIAPASLAVLLEDDAAGLRARAGVPTWAAPLSERDIDELPARLPALPADTGAIFLTHIDPARARVAQHAVHEAGGPPTLTDADTTMISLTAALLTTIARADREPSTSRVVIAGAAMLPELCPLLITTGIGDISSWNASDAHAFPLYHLVSHATAVIDLLGATSKSSGRMPGEGWSSVVSPDDPSYRLLPAAGLFAALVRSPDATVDLDVFRVCALTVAAATSPGHLVPELDDPRLTAAIASAVFRALAQRAPSGSNRMPYPTV